MVFMCFDSDLSFSDEDVSLFFERFFVGLMNVFLGSVWF